MTAVACWHAGTSRFAITDGMLRIGGLPTGSRAGPAGANPWGEAT